MRRDRLIAVTALLRAREAGTRAAAHERVTPLTRMPDLDWITSSAPPRICHERGVLIRSFDRRRPWVGMSEPAKFCPNCGAVIGHSDHFCRSCGTSLDDGEATSDKPRGSRRTWIPLVAILVVAALVGGAWAAISMNKADDQDARAAAEAEKARAAAAAQSKEHAEEVAGFRAEMRARDDVLTTERLYLRPFRAAQVKVRSYQRDLKAAQADTKRIEQEFADEFDACSRYTDVECPDPDYPEYPDAPVLENETKSMRKAAKRMSALRARLSSQPAMPVFRPFRSQLIDGLQELQSEANHNADVLDQAVTTGEGGSGLDEGKIRTLRRGEAEPMIQELNRTALTHIKRLRLSRMDFDVPGGRDIEPGDHSQLN